MGFKIDLDELHDYIKTEMQRQNIISADLAERTEIPRTTIDNYLMGKTKAPAFDRMCIILVALERSIDDVVGNPFGVAKTIREQTDKQISDARRRFREDHMEEISRIEQRRNERLQDKDNIIEAKNEHIRSLKKGIYALSILCGILLCAVLFWLVWDVLHPSNGMILY